MKILVVDDAEHMRFLLSRYFGALGHEVVALGRGEDVPAAIAADRFDVVFSDIAMPGWNGWRVLGHVRSTQPALPVVLMSGWDVDDGRPAGTVAPDVVLVPDAVVDKPFTLDRVREVLEKLPTAR
ncbi:MAG: response regulator [Candidatus Rokubacteria bacterium]|nr:response regulator [Candidatus Rokubacteria bacterium]